jgi:hypothetical protein
MILHICRHLDVPVCRSPWRTVRGNYFQPCTSGYTVSLLIVFQRIGLLYSIYIALRQPHALAQRRRHMLQGSCHQSYWRRDKLPINSKVGNWGDWVNEHDWTRSLIGENTKPMRLWQRSNLFLFCIDLFLPPTYAYIFNNSPFDGAFWSTVANINFRFHVRLSRKFPSSWIFKLSE